MWRERNGASEGEGLQSSTLDFHGGPIVPADMCGGTSNRRSSGGDENYEQNLSISSGSYGRMDVLG